MTLASDSLSLALEAPRMGMADFLPGPRAHERLFRIVTTATSGEVIRVIALDDEMDVLKPLKRLLAPRGFEVTFYTTPAEALGELRAHQSSYDVLMLDRFLGPGLDGLEILVEVRQIAPDLPVVMLSADDNRQTAAAALKAGAFYYLSKPVEDIEVVSLTLVRATHFGRLQRRARSLEHRVQLTDRFEHMIGASTAMREVFSTIAKIAETDVSVLIQGESGTGKELTARAIHDRSARGRGRGPFVAINCGAIPETLIDSELFGHARGAFTGATEARSGAFVEAHGGTVFLDEIGEIPLNVQQRLLRVLQEREVRPVGGTGARKVDVRVIAATNVNLEEMVKTGRFRPDLYYRLNVVGIRLPPLRERADDLPLIAAHLMEKHATKMRRPVSRFTSAAMDILSRYDWPGNVRELENVIQRALALTTELEVGPEALPQRLAQMRTDAGLAASLDGGQPGADGEGAAAAGGISGSTLDEELSWVDELGFKDARQRAIGSFERAYFLRLMRRVEGNVSEAARLASLDRSNLRRTLGRLGIRPEDWRGSGSGGPDGPAAND